jgi:hypothetical protein
MDGSASKIEEVNRVFRGGKGFVSLDDPSLPRGWYGGSKYLEAELYAGAFNGFDIDEFMDHLRTIEWQDPRCVQMFIREQDDERFQIINFVD